MNNHIGLHLMDVLISLFLISLALIGLNSMLIQGAKDAKTLYYSHVAMQQLSQMHEQLNGTERDVLQLIKWNKQNQAVLPQGNGQLDKAHRTLYIVWQGNEVECRNTTMNIRCLTLELLSH